MKNIQKYITIFLICVIAGFVSQWLRSSPPRGRAAARAAAIDGNLGRIARDINQIAADTETEQDVPVKTMLQSLIESPTMALGQIEKSLPQGEDAIPNTRYLINELHEDAERASHMEKLAVAMESATPLLLVEWRGGGVEWECLLFTSDKLFYMEYSDVPQLKNVNLSGDMLEAIADFSQNSVILGMEGCVSEPAFDIPLFLFTVFFEDKPEAPDMKTILFYNVEAKGDNERGGAAQAVADIKKAINNFIKLNDLDVDIFASGA